MNEHIVLVVVASLSMLLVLSMGVLLYSRLRKAGGVEGVKRAATRAAIEHPFRLYPSVSPVSQTKVISFVVGVALAMDLVLASACVVVQLVLIQRARLLKDEGLTTVATVLDCKITEDDDGDETYHVSYTFASEPVEGQSQEVRRKEDVSFEIYQRAEPGGPIEVVYARSKPNVARIKAQYTPGAVSYVPILVGASILLTSLVMLVWLNGRRRKARRLDQEGVVAAVPILDMYTDSDSEGTSYYIACQLPGSPPFKHTVSASVYNRLKVGDTVRICYLADNPKVFRLE